jgi:hypothetical protein
MRAPGQMHDCERAVQRLRQLVAVRAAEIECHPILGRIVRGTRAHETPYRLAAARESTTIGGADEAIGAGHRNELSAQNHFQPCLP